MASEGPANESELLAVDESLMSLEKLDRASPDLWPEQSVNEYVAQNSPQTEPPSWAATLAADDINKLHQVKKLHDTAYQLGLEEAKEMTRGKYLNIFKHK
ncbi:lin-52 protein isoform X6 [Neodiprion pinetum]|uniref:Protein lin-52 homolog isoform X6 n=1 Tax=Neodiprion lecontei TaxID=441921 RepID=A0ABM3GJK1_NEOLC|nr:protein lin-52 homolog isoform X6 [Neodiprion fabricii]XP_046489701.1 protein lin-52 homolog isoform X6 [Neodiprion pinetum]XP_046600450.1 protein lin-52 homolog isoform X6 [Neodiprion lecontei]XP_046626718.1 protein lin-52 homolog isoform X6 [Neodiprion virginianus]